ncbi:prepilin peptidase [Candidatus Woesearchaeota archaeon]|nr:prepilin peptidase [Candidatus Woesearchaeota archaeon]
MELIIIILALAALAIGSYTDIKSREVPDVINYGLVFLGVGLGIVFSIISKDWHILLNSLLGFLIMFIFGAVMFYTGQWGGGDAKMLMGIGALVGLEASIKTWLTNIPFLFFFIGLVLIVGGGYGLIWGIVIGIQHKKQFLEEVKKRLYQSTIKRTKVILVIASLLLIGYSFTLTFYLRLLVLILVLLLLVSFYLIIFIKIIEELGMVKEIPLSQLTEGDWINKEIKVKGKYIAGPKDLGVSKEQIALLKKLNIKKVEVKYGMPFVPAFLVAFIIALI